MDEQSKVTTIISGWETTTSLNSKVWVGYDKETDGVLFKFTAADGTITRLALSAEAARAVLRLSDKVIPTVESLTRELKDMLPMKLGDVVVGALEAATKGSFWKMVDSSAHSATLSQEK